MLSLIIDSVLIFGPVLYLHNKGREPGKELGLVAGKLEGFFVKAGAVFFALLFVSFFLGILGMLVGVDDTHKVAESIVEIVMLQPAALVYFAVVRPFAEEVFFRGFLTPKIGVLGQAAVFGALHFAYGSVFEVAGAFVLGAVLGFFFVRYKSIMPNIFAHWAYNLTAFSLIMV